MLIIVLCPLNCSRVFEILPFDPLLSDVHNGIAVEFISKPLQQTVVQTEEQSTKKIVNGQMRKKDTFSNAIDLLSVLELEHHV